jgi:6-phosphogluconolactonase
MPSMTPGGIPDTLRRSPMASRHLYIGSYTEGPDQGIAYGSLDDVSGAMRLDRELAGGANPSFIIADQSGRFLYGVSEVGKLGEHPAGGAAAIRRDPVSGQLDLINQAGTGGKAPCHLALSQDGHHLYTVSYSSGILSMHAVGSDGSLGEIGQQIQHEGSGPHRRQDKPHAHGLWITTNDLYVLACDLGTDEVIIYRRDSASGQLTRHQAYVPSAGGGPRHLAMSPDERHAYVLGELDNTITIAAWNGSAGTLSTVDRISTLPEGDDGSGKTAEIAVSADGRFVYASNRGHDSIVVCARDADSGRLTPVGHAPTLGDHPRHFCLVPDSDLLLCANQNSGNVVSYRIGSDGLPQPTGHQLACRKPVCVLPLK